MGRTPAEIIALARANVGKTFDISIPMLVAEQERQYRFTFKVTAVGARGFRDTF